MRILIVTHYFPPEIGAPQSRLSDLARLWAKAGDDVTVLTGMPNHPTGVVPPEYRGRVRCEERLDGYRVLRTWLYATPNEGVVKKTLSHLSFMVTSLLLGLRTAGPTDVVVVSSPTFFSIFSAFLLARIKRARFVVEVRDLWPAIFVELGVLKSRWIVRALESLELWAYHHADEVVVVSEGFRGNLLARGVAAKKVHTIPNGVDLERFRPSPGHHAEARQRLGARPGDTLVLYLGAHGISHGLTSVADAAAKLIDEPIHFAFVGEGAAKRQLGDRVSDLGLSNVSMLPGVQTSEVPELIAAADVCLVPLRNVPLFSTFIPSKMFEYLAMEKAVVGAVRGEPARILRDSGAAVVVSPEDSAAMVEGIRSVAADPEERARMGERGRAFVATHFNRRVLAAEYRGRLARLVHYSAPSTAKEEVREFWEAEACGERYGDQQEDARYRLEPEILRFADFPSAMDRNVLEIGVGMGADLVRFARAGAAVTGIDLTDRAIELTGRRLEAEGVSADLRVADAEDLPFPDGEFDLVYSWGTLHHTPDPAIAMREATRVLRPGGRLKVMVYQRHSWVALAAWVRFGLVRVRPWLTLRQAVSQIESPGTQAFTRREVLGLIDGLEHVQVRAVVTSWDRRVAGPLAALAGERFGWFLLLEGRKIDTRRPVLSGSREIALGT